MLQFEADRISLENRKKTAQANHDLTDNPSLKETQLIEIQECEAQLKDIERAKSRYKMDWEHKKILLLNSAVYALGLLLAFTLLTAPFMPIAGTALIAVTVTGAALCFVFSEIYNTVSGTLAINKTKAAIKEAKEDYEIKIALFRDLQNNPPSEENTNAMKLLFLEIKQLKAETTYQKEVAALQTMHLYRKIMLESLIPAIIFASLVFLPLNTGLAVLAGVVALAILSNLLISAAFKPTDKKELSDFPKEEYQEFINSLNDKKNPSKFSLFPPENKKNIGGNDCGYIPEFKT